ncbi:MAG: addiction module protein [Spirochaetes bacterium]|nr:addiction module protein [Spirochaetota bacterium]
MWDDLQNNADSLPSPSWQADVLQAREKRLQEGESSFSSWNDAKARIRKSLT